MKKIKVRPGKTTISPRRHTNPCNPVNVLEVPVG